MPIVKIGEIDVDFPYEPYRCQISYMENVIKALNERRHAILESPTGTGKTLCLLCASLSWLEHFLARQQLAVLTAWEGINKDDVGSSHGVSKFDNPLIIFSSRTHAQLNQAVQAFKNTNYSSHRISVLGSRDQLCLLPEVSQLESNSAKVYQCRIRVTTRTCDFYRNYDATREKLISSMHANPVADIEDLVKLGKESRSCPYYLSRDVKANAEVIFMPYNYLVDPKIRSTYGIDLANAVIIFDEAHNIEQVCEDASSTTLSTSLLASAIEELRVIGEHVFKMSDETGGIDSDDEDDRPSHSLALKNPLDLTQPSNNALAVVGLPRILTLKGQLIELERLLDSVVTDCSVGVIKPGEFVFELLAQAGITPQTCAQDVELINQIISASIGFENPKFRRGRGLTHMLEFLQIVFSETRSMGSATMRQDSARCYRVFIKEETVVMGNAKASNSAQHDGEAAVAAVWGLPITVIGGTEKRNIALSYWCLSPGRAIHELLAKNVRNIILTSGTLYPVNALQAELGLESALVLKNPHVINQEQVHVSVLTKAADGGTLNSGYTFRDSAAYQRSLGLSLVNLFRVIPHGVLVFFPSYALLRKCTEVWQNSEVYNKMLEQKKVFLEPRDKKLFQQVAGSYIEAACSASDGISGTGGAVLISVMRGKASEGLDLSDHASRAVVIVGLPYPPCEDPRVKIKMAYLDERRFISDGSKPSMDVMTGRQWYKLQAWRAVNQGVGRVIRHVRDYGAIFLCDERFASSESRQHLPEWMQASVHVHDSFGPALRDAAAFFRASEQKYPAPLVTFSSSRHQPGIFKLPNSSRGRVLNLMKPRQQASDLPTAASQVHVYARSFAESSGDLLSKYGSQENEPPTQSAELIFDKTAKSTSVLSQVYTAATTDAQILSKSVTVGSKRSSSEDDDLQSRLLNRQLSVKRIKLVKQHLNPQTGHTLEPGQYLAEVKKVLLKSPISEDGSSSQQNFIEFQESLKAYKMEHLPGSGVEGKHARIETVFSALSQLFIPLDAPGLLRDFIVFVREGERERFAQLCKNLTGLSVSEAPEVATMESPVDILPQSSSVTSLPSPVIAQLTECLRCHRRPILDPLKAPCGHCCCFPCWRDIIEKGSRRCPVCFALVRRRNLLRLVA